MRTDKLETAREITTRSTMQSMLGDQSTRFGLAGQNDAKELEPCFPANIHQRKNHGTLSRVFFCSLDLQNLATAHQSASEPASRQRSARSHGLHTISGPAASNHAACPMCSIAIQGRGPTTGCISSRRSLSTVGGPRRAPLPSCGRAGASSAASRSDSGECDEPGYNMLLSCWINTADSDSTTGTHPQIPTTRMRSKPTSCLLELPYTSAINALSLPL
ncbi:hypothetical protein PCH_Pc17g00890 [Penicillium rubens Wisconsin 54-1255]|uniref:Uncharacterized protein n=1 Tax=Penicillium rubens (strain ATCC 28089 / DSM 1075 / NRRL 1951 / Wisconsin 54-1255) TaxID=500485 RepID=B6HB09_PENRW|nr:hypothetical protein PCH_Pc17g00890 [Penicillium rubens Wisconsin 54-1255]